MPVEPIWKKRGFRSYAEYHEDLAVKRGFKSRAEYNEYLAKRKGFESYADEARKRYHNYRAKKYIVEHPEDKDIEDNSESLTAEFVQKQIDSFRKRSKSI